MTRVRAARPEDLDAVLAMLREGALRPRPEPWDPTVEPGYVDAWAELLASPRDELLVLDDAGEVVGCCQLTWLRHLADRGGLVAHVESVRVAAERRGAGLGTLLMAHVVERARERGATRVQLTTNVAREGAQRFYARLGFQASHVGMKLHLPAFISDDT